MARIVVLGGSFGGLTAGLELKRLLGKDADITVISGDNTFVFLPSLPWLIMGWRRPEDITLNVAEILKSKGIQFIHEAATHVDPETSKVTTTTKEVAYDYLGFTLVAAGGIHTCGVTREGSVLCWGNNNAGQLGDGTTSVRAAPMRVNSSEAFISVSTGLSHSCAMTRGGRELCWGANAYGQLGDGAGQARSTPVTVTLPGTAAILSAGWNHTCAITTDGVSYCWGRNDSGQLGDGGMSGSTVPVAVRGIANAIDIAAGNAFSCAVVGAAPGATAGAVMCWGNGTSGQLGNGSGRAPANPTDGAGPDST